MQQILKQESIEKFQTQGVTVLRGVFSKWVETLRQGVLSNLAKPNANAKLYTTDGDKNGAAGQFFSDYCSWQRIPEYHDFIFNSTAAKIGAELMHSSKVQLFHEHVLIKEPQTNIATPWHHDMPYYCVDGPKTVSLWIPLDDVPKERTLEFIAGSHRWDKSFRPQRFNGEPLNTSDNLEEIPNIEDNRDQYTILGWDLTPGDAVAFDFRTLHGAPGNNSPNTRRRAFSLRLVGDEIRFSRKENISTSPPFDHITLNNGDALSGDEFPVLYQQPR